MAISKKIISSSTKRPSFNNVEIALLYKNGRNKSWAEQLELFTPHIQSSGILNETFKIEDVSKMLHFHSKLTTDPFRDICLSLDAIKSSKPLNLRRNSDVILRYPELKKYGASWSSWEKMVAYICVNETALEVGNSDLNEGAMHIDGAITRSISENHEGTIEEKLRAHRLLNIIDDLIEIKGTSLNGLFLDFLEETNIPQKTRFAVLKSLDLTYDYKTSMLQSNNAEFELMDMDIDRVLLALLDRLFDPEMASADQQKTLGSSMLSFYIKYCDVHYEHFGTHMSKLISQLEDLTNHFSFVVAKNVFESTQELFVHGLGDYASTSIFDPAKRKIIEVLNAFVSEVIMKLARTKYPLNIDSNESEIHSYLSLIILEKNNCIASGDKRSIAKYSEIESLLKDYLLTQKSIKQINEINKLPDLINILDDLFNSKPKSLGVNPFRFLSEQVLETITQLRSFGKYFKQQLTGEVNSLSIFPVKGLAAALAIDTGSDCGEGAATLRTVNPDISIYLLADEKTEKPFGYLAHYPIFVGGKKWLFIDAFNPSTNLNLDGKSAIGELQSFLKKVLYADPDAQGFLIDKELFSNRSSIQSIIEQQMFDVFKPEGDIVVSIDSDQQMLVPQRVVQKEGAKTQEGLISQQLDFSDYPYLIGIINQGEVLFSEFIDALERKALENNDEFDDELFDPGSMDEDEFYHFNIEKESGRLDEQNEESHLLNELWSRLEEQRRFSKLEDGNITVMVSKTGISIINGTQNTEQNERDDDDYQTLRQTEHPGKSGSLILLDRRSLN